MNDPKIMDLGNTPLSFEMARNVLLDPQNASKIFTEVPYINPTGGQAYLFQSPLALCKLHAKFDPYKFMYLGKGYNKEFDVMKRYYHLKHKRTDLNKQLYNFQRHIYCLAVDEYDGTPTNLYLVHYFGNDYLLEDAVYRKGAPTVAEHGTLAEIAFDDSTDIANATSDDEVNLPSLLSNDKVECIEKPSPTPSAQSFIPSAPLVSSARKRKLCSIQPYKQDKTPSDQKVTISLDAGKPPAAELDTADYLFAMNMAARLQVLPDEIKARVKFQIATVFYEAEMKALNCPITD